MLLKSLNASCCNLVDRIVLMLIRTVTQHAEHHFRERVNGLQKAKLSARKKSEYRAAYLMIAPVVIGIAVFFIVPTIWSVLLSLTEGPDYITYEFVALKNYRTLFAAGSDMWQELLNTVYYAFVSVGVSMVISVLLANALNQDIRGQSLFRVIYFLPSVTMAAAVGMV